MKIESLQLTQLYASNMYVFLLDWNHKVNVYLWLQYCLQLLGMQLY